MNCQRLPSRSSLLSPEDPTGAPTVGTSLKQGNGGLGTVKQAVGSPRRSTRTLTTTTSRCHRHQGHHLVALEARRNLARDSTGHHRPVVYPTRRDAEPTHQTKATNPSLNLSCCQCSMASDARGWRSSSWRMSSTARCTTWLGKSMKIAAT